MKNYVAKRIRTKITDFVTALRKNFDRESGCSEVTFNTVTGTLTTGTCSIVRDCNIKGTLNVGAGATVIGCFIPEGVEVQVESCAFLVGVTFSKPMDGVSTQIYIDQGCFLLYSTMGKGDIVIKPDTAIILSNLEGSFLFSRGSTLFAAAAKSEAATTAVLGSEAVIYNARLFLKNANIGNRFTYARYSDAMNPKLDLNTHFNNVNNVDRLSNIARFNFTLRSEESLLCGDDLSIFTRGVLNASWGGNIKNGVTIIQPVDSSNDLVVNMHSCDIEDGATLYYPKRGASGITCTELGGVSIKVGRNSTVVLEGVLNAVYGYSRYEYSKRLQIPANTTVTI